MDRKPEPESAVETDFGLVTVIGSGTVVHETDGGDVIYTWEEWQAAVRSLERVAHVRHTFLQQRRRRKRIKP